VTLQASFYVAGLPAPQGSKSGVLVKGHVRLLEGKSSEARARHQAWRSAVTARAIEAKGGVTSNLAMVGPCSCVLDFVLPRPAYATRGRHKLLRWAAKRPDIDKLIRTTFDGLTDSGLIADDAQIVDVHATKVLADLGQTLGCRVVLAELGVPAVKGSERVVQSPLPFVAS
jgi:Holliday junction resolvase RusA-like endonuclease